ncbi:hypothetical protein C0991_006726 [Blastosporella zonata]|nr:hypothetical protein C0991_006726 [Blastosporella zonata]
MSRSESVIRDHVAEGATRDSAFLSLDRLAPLDTSSCPEFPEPEITVVDSDSFTAARDLMRQGTDTFGKTAVLNLASDEFPGGGWVATLTKTQEEALCYSSTLYITLKPEYYPWPNTGLGSVSGVYSPGVVIFKDDLDHDCADLLQSDRRVVSVITVAAPRRRPLNKDQTAFKDSSVLDDLRGKIRFIFRMAAHKGHHNLILGKGGQNLFVWIYD